MTAIQVKQQRGMWPVPWLSPRACCFLWPRPFTSSQETAAAGDA